jgi:hypothetical protein
MKLFEEKLQKSLQDISSGNYFLDRTPIAQEIREEIEKWDFIKLKSFCTSNKPIIRMMRQPTEENIYKMFI